MIIFINEMTEENNCYPFGLKHKGYNSNIVSEHPYKFQGQELEEELGKDTYAYHWRDYDPAIGRFNKIDRFAEKYNSFTPYHFTANNPIYFMEIAGDSIDVSDVQNKNPNGLEKLDSELETITGLELNADNGNLEYKTEKGFLGIKSAKVNRDENGKKIGSAKARRRLKRAIKNKKTLKVLDNSSIGNLGSLGVPSSDRSKLYFNFSLINTVQGFLSSDLNQLTMGAGMTFMHELDHSVVGRLTSDESRDPTKFPGPTVRRVNQIRRQLGRTFGKRAAYDPTKINGVNYMPFSSKSMKQIKRGIVPTIQYLRY